MKKTLFLSFISGLLMLAGSSTVSAQDGGIKVIPVEMFTCTYNDGKGPADLDKVADKWNKWADRQDLDDYAAWILTPYYFSPKQEFEVIWLGASKSAVALGKIQDSWNAESEGLHGDFNEVLTCAAHVNFASINFKPPQKGKTPDNAILTFSDCKYEKGATFATLGAAMGVWSQHLGDGGSNSGVYHWYPAYGGGAEEYDFKWMQTYENLESLGADYERYGNGGGFMINRNLFRHLVDCDSRRAYTAKNVRWVQLRE